MTEAKSTTPRIAVLVFLLVGLALMLIVPAGLAALTPQAPTRTEHLLADPVPGTGGYCGNPWIRCPPKHWRW